MSPCLRTYHIGTLLSLTKMRSKCDCPFSIRKVTCVGTPVSKFIVFKDKARRHRSMGVHPAHQNMVCRRHHIGVGGYVYYMTRQD
jgi:hypothetical protein